MFELIVIGIVIASFALSNTKPRKTAVFYFIMALVVLFFRIVPGSSNIFDYVIISLLFIISVFLFLIAEITEKNRTSRTYIKSFIATFGKNNSEVE